jgi:hypothetical protein
MKHLASIILVISLIMAVQPSAAQKLELPNFGGFFGALTKVINNIASPAGVIADNCKATKPKKFWIDLIKVADKSKYAVLNKDLKITKMVAVCKKRLKQKGLNTKGTEGIFVVIDKVLRMTKKERAAVRVLAPSKADTDQFVGSLK